MDIAALKTELDSGHPDTGAYNVNDETAAAELNAMNRPAEGGVDGMLSYLITNRARSNEGTDTVNTAILGRIEHVAESSVGDDPFGTGSVLTLEHIHAAKMMLRTMTSAQLSTVNFVNTEFGNALSALAGGTGCDAIRPADKTALEALSQNQQSRATELGLGRVWPINVTEARALP